jgi:hypothetical protein
MQFGTAPCHNWDKRTPETKVPDLGAFPQERSMKRSFLPFLLAVVACTPSPPVNTAANGGENPVEGYGKGARGGAGKSTCVVHSTIDECFRPGGRVSDATIVFASDTVSGGRGNRYIGSNVTLDGCARGRNGVTIRQPADAKRGIIIEGPASNVVVRCIRFEGSGPKHRGFAAEFDLLGLDGTGGLVSKVSVDRVTIVGATDGALDITGDVSDVTVQRTLLYGTPLAQLLKYGSRRRISLHHNVYAGNGERNPQIRGDARDIDFVSNIIDDCSIKKDGAGNKFDPYGFRIDNRGGAVFANVVDNFLGCRSQVMGTGGSVYTSGNAGPGVFKGNAVDPNPVPAAFAIRPTPVEELADTLGEVGSPNRTPEDEKWLDEIGRALAAWRSTASQKP